MSLKLSPVHPRPIRHYDGPGPRLPSESPSATPCRPTRETAAWGPPSLSHAARVWSFRTRSDPVRPLVSGHALPSVPCYSQLKAPSLHGHYSASPVLRASPSPCRPGLPLPGSRFGVCFPSCRASRVATFFLFHACRRHYPGGSQGVPSSLTSPSRSGLPHISGGSAPASPVSRPARRSLAFRPAWLLNRPRRPFDTRGLQTISLPP